MIDNTVIQLFHHIKACIYRERIPSENQEMNHSEPQIKARINLLVECIVNIILMLIQEKDPNYTMKFDKHILMEGEPIQRGLKREIDGKKSNPDAEVYYNGKMLCIDAKNYSKTKIGVDEVNKLIGDTEVRKGLPGILVIQKESCLDEKAYRKCIEKKIIIVRLESTSTDNEHNTCDGYLNEANLEKLEKALIAQFSKVSKVNIEKPDKKSGTLKEDKKYQDVLQASNYSHEKATKEYIKRRKEENQKKKELETQDDLQKEAKRKQRQAKRESDYNKFLQLKAKQDKKHEEYVKKYANRKKREAKKEEQHQKYLQKEANRKQRQEEKSKETSRKP